MAATPIASPPRRHKTESRETLHQVRRWSARAVKSFERNIDLSFMTFAQHGQRGSDRNHQQA
jgi:hypothetical protein